MTRTSNFLSLLFLLFILAVTLFSCFLPARAATVHVNSITGNNTECSPTNSLVGSIPCRTIEHVYNLLQGYYNVTIYIETDIDLQEVLVFRNVSNISISGILPSESHNPIKHMVKCLGTAGFHIEAVHNFSMSYLELTNCSVLEDEHSYRSAIIFKMSSEIYMFTTTLIKSYFSGIVFTDCYGNITLSKVHLNESGQFQSCPASGLTIETTRSTQPGKYTLKDCVFHGNINRYYYPQTEICSTWNSDLGGGMGIITAGKGSGIRVILDHCSFIKNIAEWGGGLHVYFGNETYNNTVIATNCYFSRNRAHNGGGGANIAFRNSRELVNRTNVAHFEHTIFIRNIAKYGGGVAISSTFADVPYSPWSNIVFTNCSWIGSIAVISPAVDISPLNVSNIERNGFLPMPAFHDIKIINSRIQNNSVKKKTLHINSGVFLVTRFKVYFYGHVYFKKNAFSALQAISSGLVFEPNTTVTFINNWGTNGAAIAMYGFSYISVSQNTSILFKNNYATNYGGGIYYSGIDQHDFLTGSSCFLEYNGPDELTVNERNITFTFEGNIAKSGGYWIYADSFLGCIHHCQRGQYYDRASLCSVSKCIGNFNCNESLGMNIIMSSGRNFTFGNTKKNYSAIPGSKFNIPFNVTDDFNQTVSPLLSMTVSNSSSPIKISRQYMLTGDIFPIGPPEHVVKVQVTVQGIRSIYFTFNLSILKCPPGFIYDNGTRVQSCVCGNDAALGKYPAILSCSTTSFRAKMKKQYWAGYIPQKSQNHEDLYFAPCYEPICSHNITYLPNTTSDHELNRIVCGENRRGVMCGRCLHNFSVYFHSRSFSCKRSKHCHLGPLFYILSEILPVIVLFVSVVTFDISFTSGNVVGFIFFSQYLDGLTLHVNHIFSILKSPYRLFYGMFNFEYFAIEELSYCLWEGLDIQDIIAFKYLTIVFALGLVLMLITLLKNDQCRTLSRLRTRVSDKTSYVRGLSAFLVICYIQCTKTSFLLLKYVHPVGLNGRHIKAVFSYYGGLPFFKGKHLAYGIVAIFSLLVLTVLPPLALLLHPLMFQLLALCGLSEHWVVLKVASLLHFHRLIPFIDCFQSCYKDRCRFFAGLYFVYRVSLLICFINTESFSSLLVYLQMLLLLFLGIHSVVQPYKERLRNITDSIIFANLALINAIAIIDFFQPTDETNFLSLFWPIIQLILLYVPMASCLIWTCWKLYCCHKNYSRKIDYEELEDDATGDREEGSLNHNQLQPTASLSDGRQL